MQLKTVSIEIDSMFFLIFFFTVPEAEEMFMNECREITEDESFEQCPSSCDVLAPFRAIDGCCNNINQRENGRAPRPFARSLEAAYEDGKEVPRGGVNPSTLPNARSVSRAVHRPQQGEKSTNATLMLMQFGQFLDHDITLTPEPGMSIIPYTLYFMSMILQRLNVVRRSSEKKMFALTLTLPQTGSSLTRKSVFHLADRMQSASLGPGNRLTCSQLL